MRRSWKLNFFGAFSSAQPLMVLGGAGQNPGELAPRFMRDFAHFQQSKFSFQGLKNEVIWSEIHVSWYLILWNGNILPWSFSLWCLGCLLLHPIQERTDIDPSPTPPFSHLYIFTQLEIKFSFGGLYWTTHKNLGYIYGLMIGYIGSTQQKQKVGEVESILVDRRHIVQMRTHLPWNKTMLGDQRLCTRIRTEF